ncbi:MAG: phage major capsid protein [Dichotomicrobium sp.]
MTITAELKKRYAAARREVMAARQPAKPARTEYRDYRALVEDSRARTNELLRKIHARRARGMPANPDPVELDTIARQDAEIARLQGRVTNGVMGRYGGHSRHRRGAGGLHSGYRAAFHSWFRSGDTSGIRAELQTQSNPDGGYLVPTEMAQEIDRVLTTVSAVRGLATVRQIGTSEFQKRVSKGGAKSGWVNETQSRETTDTPIIDQLTFNAMELYAMPEASQAMLEDGEINIEQWLAEEVSIEFADQEGDAFVNGDGNGKPRGLLAYPTVANDSFEWGKVGYIASGDASDLPADDPGDVLIDLVYALNRKWRQSATWLMNDLTAAVVRKMKDGEGNYIWQESFQQGEPSRLLGYPAEFDDNMPDIGANAYPFVFGDLRRSYLIVDRRNINVLRDPYTNKPFVRFYTTKRVGGGVQDYEAYKLLKIES